MPGPEVQADAIATALANFPLRRPAGVVTILLISLLALLVPLCGLRLGSPRSRDCEKRGSRRLGIDHAGSWRSSRAGLLGLLMR